MDYKELTEREKVVYDAGYLACSKQLVEVQRQIQEKVPIERVTLRFAADQLPCEKCKQILLRIAETR